MERQYVTNGWYLSNARVGRLPATVPGCVHTDLMASGVVQELFWRDNARHYQWIENEDWVYECTFDAEKTVPATLVFEGLDTYAEIWLNGVRLGEADDMFIPHRFDVSAVLRPDGNVLRVCFRSPVREVAHLPERKAAFTAERLYTRRIQCTYGWDWVDRFVTCGIFRDVYLAYGNGIDVASAYIYTASVDAFGAQIVTELDFTDVGNGAPALVEVLSPTGECVASTELFADMAHCVRRFDIARPLLWYPNGYGAQPLYTLRVTVGNNVFEQAFGIRTLKILQLPDAADSPYAEKARAAQQTEAGKKYDRNETFSGFAVIVNGVQIFCRGGNFVPCEPFPSAESEDKLTALVQMAKEMGANFLRVWGGGLFEKQAFYDACDRCGILVAQDFLMACGEYPEKEEWFIRALQRESEFAAKYLRNHPCLAWWHGDNENATRGSDTQRDYIGRDSALRGIAPQIARYDHTRELLPSSPYGGDTYASITCGTSHTTNFLSMIFRYFEESDCADYKEFLSQFVSRFVSEEGTFGAVSRPSMQKMMTEDDLLRDGSEEMLIYHTKNNPGLKQHIFSYVTTFAEKLLGEFADAEDRYFKYKYVQYEWVRVAFENARRAQGYCNGLVFWMFNDCWPAALGWSFVDYYTCPKHAYYAFLRGAKPVIGSVVREKDAYSLCVCSDRDAVSNVTATAYLLRDGAVSERRELTLQTKGYGVAKAALPFAYDARDIVVCDLTYENGTDRCFYREGTLPLVACDDLLSVVERTSHIITLLARGYIHCVELEGEERFADNCFSMLEGERRTVCFTGKGETPFAVRAYTLA